VQYIYSYLSLFCIAAAKSMLSLFYKKKAKIVVLKIRTMSFFLQAQRLPAFAHQHSFTLYRFIHFLKETRAHHYIGFDAY
jgi:hypothetical protein